MDTIEHGGEVAVVDDTTAPSITTSELSFADVEGAKRFMQNYQDLVEALLEDADYQPIHTKDGVKHAKKKSAWRKLATAFNITDEIIKEECTTDENGQIVKSKFYVKATLPNGRSAVGVGSCSIFDKISKKDEEQPSNFELRKRFSNAEHDVPSTAHTRAKSRAISDLIGAGEVSAEEMETEEPKRVTRTSKSNENADDSKDAQVTKSNGKRRRRAARKKSDDEAIPTKGEVVEDPVDEFKKIAENNTALKKAIQRLEDGGDEITKNSIVEELFGLYDLGTITEDEYYEAKNLIM